MAGLERRVGRERVGGRRCRRRERISADAAEEASWLFGCADGVGGGAAVVLSIFDRCFVCSRAEEVMIWRTEDKYSNNVQMCCLLIYGCWLHATPKVFVLFFGVD